MEPLEHRLEIVCCNPDTAVRHPYDRLSCFHLDSDHQRAAVRHRPQGVDDEVGDHFPDADRDDEHLSNVNGAVNDDGNGLCLGRTPMALGCVRDQGHQIRRLRVQRQ